ncbi:MAG: AEC family transporter [Lachnospiraceae bacterium]|nr:AEC family transporter [Lachnospiraceae bacterium]
MENLIFSLNATIPLFLVMVVGWFLRKIGILNEAFCKAANKFNFTVTLPVLLFKDLFESNVKESFDIKYVLFCAIVTSIAFWGLWGISKIIWKGKNFIGEFVQACYRSSAAVLGIALITNIYGSAGMVPMMIIGAVPLFNIYAVLVLTFESPGNKNKTVKDAVLGICKNPIIIAIIIGVICSMIDFEMPTMLESTISNIARMASPLALVVIGASFEGKKAIALLKPSITAAIIKLVVLPAIFLPIAIKMGYVGGHLVAILIMLGSPSTPSSYVMAKSMGSEGTLTASAVVLTTLGSAFSLTVILFILRSIGVV